MKEKNKKNYSFNLKIDIFGLPSKGIWAVMAAIKYKDIRLTINYDILEYEVLFIQWKRRLFFMAKFKVD